MGCRMIVVFDAKARHEVMCHDLERLSALAAYNAETRRIRERVAQLQEREALRLAM